MAATTADVTFRIDGQEVDELTLRRGESLEFDIVIPPLPHDGWLTLDENPLTLFNPASAGDTYTISRGHGVNGPEDVLFSETAPANSWLTSGLVGASSDAVYSLENGGVRIWDWTGDLGPSQAGDRELDLQVLTSGPNGFFSLQQVDLPDVLPFGASAGEQMHINNYDHHVYAVDDDEAFAVVSLSNIDTGHIPNSWAVFI